MADTNTEIQSKSNNGADDKDKNTQKNTTKPRKERKKKRKTSQKASKTAEDFPRIRPKPWKEDGSQLVDNITDTTVRIEKKEVQEEKEVKKTVIDTVNIHSTRTTFTQVKSNGNGTNGTSQEETKTNQPVFEKTKIIKRMNVGGYDKVPCHICTKHIYPMEMVFAEKNKYHKQCFRCANCNKIVGLDNYKMYQGKIFCPNHYRQLMIQKMDFEDNTDQPPHKKKEMIIRENIPAQLPPDVVRCNERAEDEIDHISLSKKLRNIKSRLEASVEEQDQSSNLLAVKESPLQRSPSIMDRLARYQAATSKTQVESDSDSSSDDVERDPDIVRGTKPKEQVKFTRMNSLMSKWENGAVENEAAPIVKNEDAGDEYLSIGSEDRAKSMKQKFENGTVTDGPDVNWSDKVKRDKDRDMSVFRHSGTLNKARNMFKEIDNNISKSASFCFASKPTGFSKSASCIDVNKQRSIFQPRAVKAGAIGEKFKFFEKYDGSPSLEKKRFQMTPPKESEDSDSSDDEVERDPNVVRGSYTARGDIPRSNTTAKMLSKFKAMENPKIPESKPNSKVVRPAEKVVTPKAFSKTSDSDKDSSSDSEDAETHGHQTAKRIAVEADKAKSLKNKFENWQNHNNKENIRRSSDMRTSATCSNLRAKFESTKDESTKPKGNPPPKINRFVANIAEQDKCGNCNKRVYALEKINVNKMVLHKTCFKCSVCSSFLSMNTYTTLNSVLYCTTHFKQLFAMKGNYDEGFGREQHKDKWSTKITTNGEANKESLPPTQNGHFENTNGRLNEHIETSSHDTSAICREESTLNQNLLNSEDHNPKPKLNGNHETHEPIPTIETIDVEVEENLQSNDEEFEKIFDNSEDISEMSNGILDSTNASEMDEKEYRLEAEVDEAQDTELIEEESRDIEEDSQDIEEESEHTEEEEESQPIEEESDHEEVVVSNPPIPCVKVATSIHGYIEEPEGSQEDLLYENVTILKEKSFLTSTEFGAFETEVNGKKYDMERSFASDDSLDNYLKESEEIEGFDMDAYLDEGVGDKREDSDGKLNSH